MRNVALHFFAKTFFADDSNIAAVSTKIRGFVDPESAMHYLLIYKYVPDVLERRPQFRGAHVGHARASVARGQLLLGGAFADPVDGAVLFFSAPSKDVVEAFAKVDPYVTGGLVTEWTVREWTTVIGPGAAHPLPPGV